MKKTSLLLTATVVSAMAMAQNNVTLNIEHEFNGSSFAYGQTYTDASGAVVSFDRVQYYLSGINVTHDGGQNTPLTDVYVLASGNISNYSLGTFNIDNVESFNFDLGVDAVVNAGNTSNYSAPHPLALQSPSMDWGWPSGYFFIVVDGMVDSNGDGTPNAPFQFHGLGDHLLRNVTVNCQDAASGGNLTINLFANVADWVQTMDLTTVGVQHNGGAEVVELCDNTNDYTVFTPDTQMSDNDIAKPAYSLHVDCTIAYAPTIYYTFENKEALDLVITDINGKVVLRETALPNEGNYFIKKEFPTGIYIATFSNGNSVKESIKFTVTR